MCLQSSAGAQSTVTNYQVMLFNSPEGIPAAHFCANVASKFPQTALFIFIIYSFLSYLCSAEERAYLFKGGRHAKANGCRGGVHQIGDKSVNNSKCHLFLH